MDPDFTPATPNRPPVTGNQDDGPPEVAGRSDRDVIIRTLEVASVAREGQRRRLDLIAALESAHISRCLKVDETPNGFTVIIERVEGPTLSTLKMSKTGLTLPEAWRLIEDICHGLLSLHDAGLIHGGISPDNVVVRKRQEPGRAVIVDLVAEPGWDRGTPGFVAPEVRTGAAPSAATDVWAVARLATWAVRNEERQQLAEYLRPALSDQPADRPTVKELANMAHEDADDRIDLPDEARLAAAHLRVQHHQQPLTRAQGRRGRRRGPDSRPRWAIPPVLASIVFLALAGSSYSLTSFLTPSPDPAPTVAESQGEPEQDRVTLATRAVTKLTLLRDQALERRDADLLTRLSVPGSPAASSDDELLAAMGGSSPTGLRTSLEIRSATEQGDEVVIEADLSQQGFTWSGGARNSNHVAPLPKRCAAIHLAEHGGEFRVQRVSACAAEGTSG